MAKNPEKFLRRLLRDNEVQKRIQQVLLVLSLFVMMSVFWSLKLTGITMAGDAFCGYAEHVHGDNCPTGILICELLEAEPHSHSESCILRELICQEQEREGHAHTDACYARQLACMLDAVQDHVHSYLCGSLVCTETQQEAHSHADECYKKILLCEDLSEEHIHEEGCFDWEQTCTREENPGHTHSDSCYSLEEGYACGIHVHADSCYRPEKINICKLEEDPGHVHADDCYRLGIGFGCGETEEQGHVHNLECVSGETEIGCGKEASEGHIHQDECYQKTEKCPLEEHIHVESCYSDIKADLETEEDWIRGFAHLEMSAVTADNVVAIAQTQLGQGESTLNFQVDAYGVRRGATRYGQWYGNIYGDWSAMFASFCLHYAGVEDVPVNAGPESMRLEWEQAGLYVSAEEYSPRYGDLLFLHKQPEPELTAEGEETEATEAMAAVLPDPERKPPANAVAIITGFDGVNITVIEGDLGDQVAETSYPAEDPVVLGYGMVPEVSDYALMIMPRAGVKPVAQTTSYNTGNFTATNRFVLYATVNGADYAIDGAGNPVPVYVQDNVIHAEVEDSSQLLWVLTKGSGNNNYYIKNVATGRSLYPTASSVSSTGEYTCNLSNNNTTGLLVRGGNNYYPRLNANTGAFTTTTNQSQATRFKLGISSSYTVWLDGTGGGQGQHGGSPNEKYTVNYGDILVLPTEWQSPKKYAQRIRGWYDVTNQTYYGPGAEVTVTGNMVFYADWVAAHYDFGEFNSKTSDTVSTNAFITAHVFDYNYLFNVMSANATVDVSASSHTETWKMVENGKVDYNDRESLEFVFVDYDGSSRLPDMSGRNDHNNYHGVGVITQGIYRPELVELLFGKGNDINPETGEGVIGKTYLGTGDHLFQFMDDPSDEHYGYYYYDSTRNAASYNQSQQRFYVYDYLEATSDSISSDTRSDFLPFNSPYANTNGNTVRTYSYDGVRGEYGGTTHYRYDSKYSDSNNGDGYVHTNYASGLHMQVSFYLPNQPGEVVADGGYGNQDLYGNDMHFQFKGDDDVWVLVDGTLVLDLGGIHGIEGGDINFATGVVTINGTVDQTLTNALKKVSAGEHTLNIYYLERGSSQSNCAFFFNLAPRFSLSIQKEDVLTQELLNGAQFSVYTDAACTKPAELWESEAAHNAGKPSTNVFTVTKGVANMWGFASGNTYYIKETRPPDAEAYDFTHGIIRLTIDKDGIASYDVEILNDGKNNVSPGFTVHGIKIDQETQNAYIVATNAPTWVKEVTTVQVQKRWNDTKDHSGDHLTAYLTVTDADGTVRRIREVYLGPENDWKYTWTNLPKFAADGVTPIQYGIQEAYVDGYQGQVRKVEKFTVVTEEWAEAVDLKDKQTYVIRSSSGYLSTTGSGADTGYKWVDEQTAKSSQYALWTANANSSGSAYKLTNGAGQTITFYYNNGSPTDFYSSTGGETDAGKQYFSVRKENNGIKLYYDPSNSSTNYYMTSSMNSSGKFGYNTNHASGMVLVPSTKIEKTHTEAISGWGYEIVNTPLEEETSLEVRKEWVNPNGDDPTLYQTEQVTIRLLANGQFTGRTVTLNLKNGWKDTFRGLPAKDEAGNVIRYTVEESWTTEDWVPTYGEITAIGTEKPIYTTTVTNMYRVGGPILPATGSPGRMLYILCGAAIMLTSLGYGIVLRFQRERRRK